jgi:hypothetical protein
MTSITHAAMRRTTATAGSENSASRGLGALLIADALLSFAPVAVLGAAIGWPASLDNPAAEQLAAVHANAGMVTLGYGLYLLYSVLVAPVMIGLAAKVFGGLHRPAAATVAAFGALSALARAIGILRWLTVMPALAAAHAAAGPEQRAQIELLFSAVTSYGGGIGEVLGVALFMALSMGTLCAAALRSGGMPRWLAALGLASTVLLAGLLLPVFGGPELVPVAAAVSLLSLWMLAAGVWALRRS